MLVGIGWLWLYSRGRVQVTETARQAKYIILCFALFVFWVFFQILPLPASLLEILSPESAATQSFLTDSVGSLSINPFYTLDSALKSVSYLLLFLMSILLLNSRLRIKYFAAAIVLGGLFQAVYGSLMMLSGVEYTFFVPKSASLDAASGTFVNRNHFAGYLEMTLSVGTGLMIASLSRQPAGSAREWFQRLALALLGPKGRLRIALAIMVIALVLSRSRMGNSAFFISLAVAGVIGLIGLWWLARKGEISEKTRRPVLIFFMSVLIIDVFIVGAWFGIDKVKERIQSTSFASEIRDEVDINSLDQIQAFLISGSGGGTFAEVFPAYKTALYPGFIDHAHNDFLEMAGEFGLFGMALLSVIVLWSFIKAIQAQFVRRSSLMRGIGFASTMAIVAIMIHSTVDFNLQIPANAALFVVLLALAWLSCYQSTHPPETRKRKSH